MNKPKIPPPERRKRPEAYSDDELFTMLVDDGVHHRPLGGNGERGIQWMMDALGKIAAVRRIEIEAAFVQVNQAIAAEIGDTRLVVG